MHTSGLLFDQTHESECAISVQHKPRMLSTLKSVAQKTFQIGNILYMFTMRAYIFSTSICSSYRVSSVLAKKQLFSSLMEMVTHPLPLFKYVYSSKVKRTQRYSVFYVTHRHEFCAHYQQSPPDNGLNVNFNHFQLSTIHRVNWMLNEWSVIPSIFYCVSCEIIRFVTFYFLFCLCENKQINQCFAKWILL